jgi:putative sigma-54 modulation protein
MKVTYTGIHQALPPRIQAKLDAKFAKLAKLLDGRGEREAHVIVTQSRHLYRAEVTLPFYDHQLVSVGSDVDLPTALLATLDTLEKQAVKQRSKWRDKGRRQDGPQMQDVEVPAKGKAKPKPAAVKTAPAKAPSAKAAPPKPDGDPGKRVFRVNRRGGRKPITLDEAVMEMDKDRDYLVYHDAERDGVSVLVRRRDGHFDLIES